ncbi:hypothetical protein ALT721_800046 [Alteromonas alvinellae]
MSKYSEIDNRARNIENTLRMVRSNPNRWLIDASYQVSDKDMEYYTKLQAECDRYLNAVIEILEEQSKADQAKLDAIEELLSE